MIGELLTGGRKWLPLEAQEDAEGEQRAVARAFLSDVLQADTLIVLAGLGTSLGIKSESRKAPSMTDLWEKITALPEFRDAAQHLPRETGSGNLEALLSEAILRSSLDHNESLNAFVKAAEHAVLTECRFVEPTMTLPSHERLLRRVARRSPRSRRAQIFTTNYDRAFETAAAATRTTVVDGFGIGGSGTFDGSWFDIDFVRRRVNDTSMPEPNVVHLLKMHGSVDWTQQSRRVVKTNELPSNPVLIYPAQNKFQLSYQQPYQEIMARFQMALREPDVGLLVAGFGFRDDHITAPIESALRSNVGLKMAVMDPALNSPERRSDFASMLERLALEGDERLALIASTFDDGVSLLPDIGGRTELESHADRIDRALSNGTE